MSQKIWVVEMLSRFDKWEPTVGVSLTREDCRLVMLQWRRSNPFDKFRLAKYERTP